MSRRRPQPWDNNKMSYVEFEVEPPTPEQARAASLTVCEYAEDATVARELLQMLGLGT